MPHIISRNYTDAAHPLFKKKSPSGALRRNSPERDKDDKKSIPRSYDSVKEAAGARETVQLTSKKR